MILERKPESFHGQVLKREQELGAICKKQLDVLP
jgi:hypothetical protein